MYFVTDIVGMSRGSRILSVKKKNNKWIYLISNFINMVNKKIIMLYFDVKKNNNVLCEKITLIGPISKNSKNQVNF